MIHDEKKMKCNFDIISPHLSKAREYITHTSNDDVDARCLFHGGRKLRYLMPGTPAIASLPMPSMLNTPDFKGAPRRDL